ncbi:hypothetical protein CGZ93_17885 [Enemella dayhoffiae]|uniref:Uncharacterized protein n=1 Tax=Enemella dayhoffiae TaxID=2016507 RepID=A0A255GM42_9ACTN|nr:hypothetical protein [Enemella dayhoffiae]OYO16631.1 hypothetical protein CGZ93_17885 [Enemella dayhoffiae]
MADQYIVKAAAAVVQPKDGGEVYAYRGALVPADARNLKHLTSTGLVEKLEVLESEPADGAATDSGNAAGGEAKPTRRRAN